MTKFYATSDLTPWLETYTERATADNLFLYEVGLRAANFAQPITDWRI